MQIQRYQGRNLRDALLRAHRDFGDDAVVVSREAAPGGGVTIAVAPPRAKQRRAASSRGGVSADVRGRSVASTGEDAAPVLVQAAEAEPAPLTAQEARREGLERGLREVEHRMRAAGASKGLITRVLRSVARAGGRGAYAIDVAAQELGKAFPIAGSPKRTSAAPLLAFVGPTGVGKTTTIAKLGTRLVMGGNRVAFITLDTYRVGAVEQLQTYSDLLESPLEVARSVEDVLEVAQTYSDYSAILVDTTGRSPHDAESVNAMASLLTRAGEHRPLWTYLVLAAPAGVGALDEAYNSFRCCKPKAAVLTKLDETRAPLPAVEFTRFVGLDTAFLCDGQDASKHLHRPRPDHFADLALRGKIA